MNLFAVTVEFLSKYSVLIGGMLTTAGLILTILHKITKYLFISILTAQLEPIKTALLQNRKEFSSVLGLVNTGLDDIHRIVAELTPNGGSHLSDVIHNINKKVDQIIESS